MPEHFCTYFDHRYAAKGLAMWRSLKAHHPSAALHVLCLNETCREIIGGLRLDDVWLHSLRDLESAYPQLLEARSNRTTIEYYFTLTPFLPLHVLNTHPHIPRVTYVDADLFFFADPQPVLDEVDGATIGVIEHRFSPGLSHLQRHGRFNVGWLTFTNDPTASRVLHSWCQQCIEWCFDRLEDERFAEQKYLDSWPTRFDRVCVIEHPGANLGPWNLKRFSLRQEAGRVLVDGRPLIFFHAHGFVPTSPGSHRDANLAKYGVDESAVLKEAILDVYDEALRESTASIALPLAQALLSDYVRDTVSMLQTLKTRVAALERDIPVIEMDRVARLQLIHDVQRQLDASDADRAARLELIHDVQRRLDASEADRAARLELIHDVQRRLDASEADRVARLELIHELQRRLDASEADRAARLELIHELQHRLRTSAAQLEAVERELQTATSDLQETRAALARAHLQVERIEQSRTWRWTWPIRRLVRVFVNREP